MTKKELYNKVLEAGGKLAGFAFFVLGEGIEKREDNLADEVAKMLKLEEKQIPDDIDYEKVRNIATEAKQKFSKIRPRTIGQASRISGVNPSDITMLLVYLKKEYNND